MPALYRAADALVLPSRCEETFGRVLVEVMACGIPAVGTAVGGVPEVLGGEFERFCVPPEDPSSLAEVLRSLSTWRLADPDLADRCRAHVNERFPLQRAIDRVAELLFPGAFSVGCEGFTRSASSRVAGGHACSEAACLPAGRLCRPA